MKSTLCRLLAGALLTITASAGISSIAEAQSCQDLWVERNSYYKEAGYCFKTRQAIAYFGNRGCVFYDEASVPLSRAARFRIAQITSLERRFGCNW